MEHKGEMSEIEHDLIIQIALDTQASSITYSIGYKGRIPTIQIANGDLNDLQQSHPDLITPDVIDFLAEEKEAIRNVELTEKISTKRPKISKRVASKRVKAKKSQIDLSKKVEE